MRYRFRGLVLVLTAVALSWAALGCGGGGNSDSTSAAEGESTPITVKPSAISKAAYIDRSKQICGKAGKKMFAALTSPGEADQSDAERMEEITQSELDPAVEQEISELQKLGAPKGEVKEVEALLNALQAGVDATAEHPVATVKDFGIGFRHYDRLANAYGLEGCAFELA